MNWTGGSLSRSRKQKTDISLAQKKHFAKARGRLLSGHSPRPRIDHTVFQDASLRDATLSSTTSIDSPRRNRGQSQLTLEEYESVQPLVKQLRSLKPRQGPQKGAVYHSDQLQSRETSLTQQGEESTQLQGKHLDRSAYARIDTERMHGSSCDPVIPCGTDQLEAKRQQLLASFDWVGLEKMKPVKMHFQDAEERDLIGKRRDLRALRNGGHPVAQQHRRAVVNIHEKLNILQTNSKSLSSPGKMSVHIGTSDSASSTYRGSVRELENDRCEKHPASEEALVQDMQSNSLGHSLSSLQPASRLSSQISDEMLFDHEWFDITSTPRKKPVIVTACFQEQSELDSPRQTTSSVHQHEIHTISSGTESEYTDEPQEEEEASELRQYSRNVIRPDVEDQPSYAEATAQDIADLCLADGDLVPTSYRLRHGDQPEAKVASTGSEGWGSKDVPSPRAGAASIQVRREQHKDSHDPPATANLQLKVAPADAVTTLGGLTIKQQQPSPLPFNRQPEPRPHQPASQKDDELLWRSFVFGTENPSQDWTLNPPLEQSGLFPVRRTCTTSSSPIRPAFQSDLEAPSSPIPRTQPSLIAEAPSSSPKKPTNNTSSPPLEPAFSSSPSRQHHHDPSLAAQPSTSPVKLLKQIYASSSDELVHSPMRLAPAPPPPVTFRKPRPYIGEAAASSPLRLGIAPRRRKRRAEAPEDRDGDESFSRRRKRRRDANSPVSDREDAGDEIIDDLI
ncbi:MAG: hypothetical protein Q9222_003199 [Ikaeria aurantiellina]